MKKIILSLLLLVFYFQFNGQNNIYLKSNTIDYSKELNLDFSSENNYCLLVLSKVPTNQQKQSIELLGIKILEYIPKNTFLINAPKNFDKNLLNEFGLLNIFNVQPQFKIDPKIQNGKSPNWAIKDNQLSIKIIFYDDVDFVSIKEKFNNAGYSINQENFKSSSLIINIKKDDLNKISNINEVWFIEPIDPPRIYFFISTK